jgi:N-acetyl-gamma-glutamyl-phosphate reductase
MKSQHIHKVAVIGASGYAGGELVSILMRHPKVQLALITSSEKAGSRLESVHPHLRGLSDLEFAPHPGSNAAELLSDIDIVFLAVPHGVSMKIVPTLPSHVKVIDLTGDFRLSDPRQFEKYYGCKHDAMQHQSQFVYGLTEVNRLRIGAARYVANPGCFATAIQLALYPLIKHDVIEGTIIIDAKTGSSGSGHTPGEATHHPSRSSGFCAYKPFSHQHLAEIEQLVAEHQVRPLGEVILQTHSAPMVRGIFATLYLKMREEFGSAALREFFTASYGVAPFIRYVPGSPNVSWVKHTNFVDIGWAFSGHHLIVYSALDNLVKGAAGAAVQNMNLMLGLDETLALLSVGGYPS